MFLTVVFLYLISRLIVLWTEKMLDMISIFLNLLRFDLWAKMWSILENVPCALEKKVYSPAFGWNVLKISMRSISYNVLFKNCVSLLIFCFNDLSIGVNGVSPTTIVLLSISLLCLLVFVLCVEVLLFCVHRYLQFCYVFLLDWYLDHYVVSFLISCNLYFNLYFVWYEDCYSSFLLLPICMKWSEVKSLSCVWLIVALWTVAYQALLSMGFSKQEYWNGLSFPSPGYLPDPGIKPGSPSLQAEALPSEPPGKSILLCLHRLNWVIKEKEYGSQHCSLLKWSEVTQLCLTLCDPMDCTILHSSVHGIFQARVLEWGAISFSRGSSWPRDRTQFSCTVGRRFTI